MRKSDINSVISITDKYPILPVLPHVCRFQQGCLNTHPLQQPGVAKMTISATSISSCQTSTIHKNLVTIHQCVILIQHNQIFATCESLSPATILGMNLLTLNVWAPWAFKVFWRRRGSSSRTWNIQLDSDIRIKSSQLNDHDLSLSGSPTDLLFKSKWVGEPD